MKNYQLPQIEVVNNDKPSGPARSRKIFDAARQFGYLLSSLILFPAASALAQTSQTATVTVTISGKGYTSQNLFGENLKIGKTISLTAISESGQVFSNWSGAINSTKNPLTFQIMSNMVLQANFIANPFEFWDGTYNGLFSTTNGVTMQTAGMLKNLIVSEKGYFTDMPSQTATYSGTILIDGQAHPITGNFGLAGRATNRVSRPASQGGPLSVEMQLSTNYFQAEWPFGVITGIVSGINQGVPWVANLTTCPFSGPNPRFSIGNFTMVLPPNADNSPPNSSPGGFGYIFTENGNLDGTLADGTSFSQPLLSAFYYNCLPLCVRLYGNKGLLFGWIDLGQTNDYPLWVQPSLANIGLTWIRPKSSSGLYKDGFTNSISASQFIISPNLMRPYGEPPANFNLMTNLWIGNADGTIAPIPVSTDTPYKVVGASVSGTVQNNGLITVTVGKGASKITGHGAITYGSNVLSYEDDAVGFYGYFLTKTNSQAFILGP